MCVCVHVEKAPTDFLPSHHPRTPGRQADPATAAEVLKAALQLLKRLVLWVSPELLTRPEMNFLQVFW